MDSIQADTNTDTITLGDIARLCQNMTESFVCRTFNLLCGGEPQRSHFAMAMLHTWNPLNDGTCRYLMLEESASSLDMTYELEILKLTKRVSEEGVGSLVVLHDLNLAARYADYVYLLVDGEVFCEGEIPEVFTSDVLTKKYQLPISVEWHENLNRLLVIAN